MLLQTALLAHVVAQTAAIFRRDIAPARRSTVFAAKLPLLLPMLAHLLAHLAPLVRWQIAPISLRPGATRRAEQAQEQQRTGSKAFHGRKEIGCADSIIVHRAGNSLWLEM